VGSDALPTQSPVSRPQDVVLHIGCRKTGTSSIQFFLRDNRERLLELGLLYPSTPGRARHVRLGLFAKTQAELRRSPEWYRQKQRNRAKFRAAFLRRVQGEIEDHGLSRVLFSDEDLYGCSRPALRRLHRFTAAMSRSLRLVVYLRRQDDHLVSVYQQQVKIGEVLRLDAWAQQDMTAIYDYAARLRLWQRLLEPTELVVRRFEADSFVDGSLFQDFFDAAGVEARAEDMEHGSHRNDSLDVDSVEFLRLLNLYRVENEGATAGLIDNRNLVARLSEASTGPVLTLPAPTLDAFMARWEGSNRDVARQFLADGSGRLFRADRKTRNTTTEQQLDPARVDELVALLELPDRWRDPLRRLAEREARVG
jgi:hypothetical protein